MIGHYPRGAAPSSLRPPATGGRREERAALLVVSPRLHRRKVGGGHFASQGGHFRQLKGQVTALAGRFTSPGPGPSDGLGAVAVFPQIPTASGDGDLGKNMRGCYSKGPGIDIKWPGNAVRWPLKCYKSASFPKAGDRHWRAWGRCFAALSMTRHKGLVGYAPDSSSGVWHYAERPQAVIPSPCGFAERRRGIAPRFPRDGLPWECSLHTATGAEEREIPRLR
jgi:hypothetical protein